MNVDSCLLSRKGHVLHASTIRHGARTKTMFQLLLEKWRALYVGESRRAGRVAGTGLSYVRHSEQGLLSLAITETGENLLGLGERSSARAAWYERWLTPLGYIPTRLTLV